MMKSGVATSVVLLVAVSLAHAAPEPLQVGNEGGKVAPLTAQDWEKLPRQKVDVKDKDGTSVR